MPNFTGPMATNPPVGGGPIASQFLMDHANRTFILEEAREASRLTIPSILPPQNWNERMPLPLNYQSLGARGSSYLTGKVLLAVFSPDRPWIQTEVDPASWFDPSLDPDTVQSAQDFLFYRDQIILAMMESANFDSDRGDLLGFRTIQRQALSQILITGDCLQRMDSDMRLTNFRRDRYITMRTDSGSVQYHITVEGKDPLELDNAQLEECGLRYDDLKDKPMAEREMPLFTKIEWQPRSKSWKIEQELNGKCFNESEEAITNHISIPFELAPRANYGRGIIMNNRGDLKSFDSLCQSLLAFAAACSKHHPVIDPRSELKPTDLEQPPGTCLVDRVEGGQPAFIGMLQLARMNDYQVVHAHMETLRQAIGKAMLLDSETVRDSERTTLGEVQQVTLKELHGALGAFYAPVADQWQLRLFERAQHEVTKKLKWKPIPKEAVRMRVLTGIEALAKQASASRMLDLIPVAKELDPDGVVLNSTRVLESLIRMNGVYEPGIIRTPQEQHSLREQAMKMQLQLAAGQQAIQSTGAVAEQAAGAAINGGSNSRAA